MARIGKDAFLFQIYRLMVNEIMNICCKMLDRKGLEWNGPPNLQTRTYAARLITRTRLPNWPPQDRKAPIVYLL
eukprot:scaffold3056_cov225-Chaetoceros_neogracile.AAC.2